MYQNFGRIVCSVAVVKPCLGDGSIARTACGYIVHNPGLVGIIVVVSCPFFSHSVTSFRRICCLLNGSYSFGTVGIFLYKAYFSCLVEIFIALRVIFGQIRYCIIPCSVCFIAGNTVFVNGLVAVNTCVYVRNVAGGTAVKLEDDAINILEVCLRDCIMPVLFQSVFTRGRDGIGLGIAVTIGCRAICSTALLLAARFSIRSG